MLEFNNVYQIYLTLRHICDIVMSHIIKKSCLTYLQEMIENFLKIYVDEFDSQSLTCKFHYMVHYPSQILKYGPLKKFGI